MNELRLDNLHEMFAFHEKTTSRTGNTTTQPVSYEQFEKTGLGTSISELFGNGNPERFIQKLEFDGITVNIVTNVGVFAVDSREYFLNGLFSKPLSENLVIFSQLAGNCIASKHKAVISILPANSFVKALLEVANVRLAEIELLNSPEYFEELSIITQKFASGNGEFAGIQCDAELSRIANEALANEALKAKQISLATFWLEFDELLNKFGLTFTSVNKDTDGFRVYRVSDYNAVLQHLNDITTAIDAVGLVSNSDFASEFAKFRNEVSILIKFA